MRVKIRGGDRLMKLLKRLPTELTAEVRATIKREAGALAEDIRARAPKDTGALKSAIRARLASLNSRATRSPTFGTPTASAETSAPTSDI